MYVCLKVIGTHLGAHAWGNTGAVEKGDAFCDRLQIPVVDSVLNLRSRRLPEANLNACRTLPPPLDDYVSVVLVV